MSREHTKDEFYHLCRYNPVKATQLMRDLQMNYLKEKLNRIDLEKRVKELEAKTRGVIKQGVIKNG